MPEKSKPTSEQLKLAGDQLAELCRGTVEVHTAKELHERLAESMATGRPLRVKAGFDPTAPDLHIGHAVLLTKMQQLQRLGHEIHFVIGDFTARIGDPTGKKEMRPMLSPEEIAANAETYKRQVFRILDPERTKVCFNGDWLLPLTAADMVRLASKMTVARMLEREDFKLRYRQGQPIGVHELLYPLAQGYDSVALEADIELGGSDQLFNLLVGRELQRDHGQAPQIVMTLPLLEGTDAHEEDGKITGAKMSKSLGNYVGIEEPAPQQYGKLMSVSDGLMWRYYELLSARSTKELEALRASVATGRVHPMQAKRDLAHELVSRFRSPAEADAAAEDFRVRFSKREIPQDLPEVELEVGSEGLPLFQLLREAGLSQSGKEARRSCAQGAVKVDGEKVTDPTAVLEPGPPRVVQVGKRKMARVTLR